MSHLIYNVCKQSSRPPMSNGLRSLISLDLYPRLRPRHSLCRPHPMLIKHSYHQYLPLKDTGSAHQDDPNVWGMRAVFLRPGSHDSEIYCDLGNTTIGKSQGNYEALSYAWGDASETSLIFLDGEPFPVTNNLATALRNLREANETRKLWIDAICINQRDIPERNLQVQRMWAIFQNASQVVVFLGKETEHTRPALELVKRIVELAAVNSDGAAIASVSHSESYLKAWEGIRDLLERPWWRRVWVAQVAVATDVVVICGLHALPWKYFDALINIYQNFFTQPLRPETALPFPHLRWDAAAAIQRARNQYQESHEDEGLAALLIRFRSAKSSDPRDKVYGLLRLSKESANIRPDYSKPIAEVFKETVRSSINKESGLAILSAVNYVVKDYDLPSWCPNWEAESPPNLPFFEPRFRSAGDSAPNPSFDHDIMTLRGIRLDEIKTARSLRDDYSVLDENTRRELKELVLEQRKTECPYQDPSEALDQTLYINSLDHVLQWMNARPASLEEPASRLYMAWYRQRPLEDALLSHITATRGHGPGAVFGLRDALSFTAKGRKFFVSDRGYMGLVPSAARENDLLVVFHGGRVPFCIRPKHVSNSGKSVLSMTYELIGDCYVHGYMNAEAIAQAESGQLREEDFKLV